MILFLFSCGGISIISPRESFPKNSYAKKYKMR